MDIPRKLINHKVNGLNESIEILVTDPPGQGGACHEYRIEYAHNGPTCNAIDIHFQQGPIKENGVNGISQEALLTIIEDRLHCFETGPYACQENAMALFHIREAMQYLKQRTIKRIERGVEGTSEK
jgi:hypothetical protein